MVAQLEGPKVTTNPVAVTEEIPKRFRYESHLQEIYRYGDHQIPAVGGNSVSGMLVSARDFSVIVA